MVGHLISQEESAPTPDRPSYGDQRATIDVGRALGVVRHGSGYVTAKQLHRQVNGRQTADAPPVFFLLEALKERQCICATNGVQRGIVIGFQLRTLLSAKGGSVTECRANVGQVA